jgi:DNA modification methylase
MDLPLDEIICGDNCDVLGTLPRECIDLVVTSPPYDDLRTYGGHSWDFYGVAWQLKRVLKPGGVIVWVVADATKDGSETGTSMRQALHFKEIGLNLHDTMIYKKSGSTPNIHHPRYVHCWEYQFVFSLGTPRAFHPHKKRRNSTAGVIRKPTTKMQRNGDLKAFNTETKETPDESLECNVWEYLVGGASGDEGTGNHSAYFPEALARDHILSWSNEGDIVLDPFSGSGTTAKMARELGRHYIGIEVNPDYVEISRKRLEQKLLFGVEASA